MTHAEHLLISGSSIGVVVVSRLDSGQMVQRLENHRGMISAVAVNRGDDVFATGKFRTIDGLCEIHGSFLELIL